MLADHIPTLDTTAGLLGAATAVSAHELGDPLLTDIENRLEKIAQRIRDRVSSGSDRAYLAHLHQIMFVEEGFRGATRDYYDPGNSYLPVVLTRRRGIPITLALIYKAIAERLGLRAYGINAPGHFLVAVSCDGRLQMIDPFHGGRLLSREDAFALIEKCTGERYHPTDQLLLPATHRQWLIRLINNLQNIFANTGRRQDLAAMMEMAQLVNEGTC